MEKSILINLQPSDAMDIVLKTIPEIFGKIIKRKSRQIVWEYEIGIHTITCKTELIPLGNQTEIITSASSETRKSSLLPIIEKFQKALVDKNSSSKKPTQVKNTNNKGIFTAIKSKQITFGIILLIIGVFVFTKNSSPKNYVTSQGYYGAYYKSDLENFMRFISDGDENAAYKLISRGSVFEVPQGENAYLIKSEFSGTVKIRLEGNSQEFWTVKEVITK